MKYYPLTFLYVCLNFTLWGQVSKFKFGVEYSPNFSKITDEIVDEDFKLSHNIFAKSTYSIAEKFKVSLGMGLINTGEMEVSEFSGTHGIDKIKFVHNYNYIAIPIGIKYKTGAWFINPEVAVAVNISNIRKVVVWHSNGDKEVEKDEELIYGAEFTKITIPIMLTTGYEIEINNTILILGIKGYYSFRQVGSETPRKAHYYGLGIVAGIEF